MTNQTPSNSVVTEAMIEAALTDLRDRRLLKWLFPADPDHSAAIGYVEGPIDLETQREVVTAIYLAMQSTNTTGPSAATKRMAETMGCEFVPKGTGSDELVERRALAEMLRDHSIYCTAPDGRFRRAADLIEANAIATPDTDRVAVLTEALREARRFVEEQPSSHPRSSLLRKIDAIIRQGAGK